MVAISKWWATALMAACVCTLMSGCGDSHRPNAGTSGSNWLKCTKLAECVAAGAEEAVACSESFCVDAQGKRIAARRERGGTSGSGVGAGSGTGAGSAARSGAGGAMAAGSSEPGSGAGSNAPEPSCLYALDELLAELGATAKDRVNCGYHSNTDVTSVAGAMQCFERAVEASDAVELTINECMDCSIPTTYVATATGEHFVVTRQEPFGPDRMRHTTVGTCGAIVFQEISGRVRCVDGAIGYSCSEPENTDHPSAPPPVPITPYKLADVASPGNVARETLHLYISNQSFDEPLMNIEVIVDETRVVIGDFAVEGQHSWHELEVLVPVGTHTVTVESRNRVVTLEQAIDLPGERWAVINYWNEGTLDSEMFSLALHDEPVTFE